MSCKGGQPEKGGGCHNRANRPGADLLLDSCLDPLAEELV